MPIPLNFIIGEGDRGENDTNRHSVIPGRDTAEQLAERYARCACGGWRSAKAPRCLRCAYRQRGRNVVHETVTDPELLAERNRLVIALAEIQMEAEGQVDQWDGRNADRFWQSRRFAGAVRGAIERATPAAVSLTPLPPHQRIIGAYRDLREARIALLGGPPELIYLAEEILPMMRAIDGWLREHPATEEVE